MEWGLVGQRVSLAQPTRDWKSRESIMSSSSRVLGKALTANTFSAYSKPQNDSHRPNLFHFQSSSAVWTTDPTSFCRCPVLGGHCSRLLKTVFLLVCYQLQTSHWSKRRGCTHVLVRLIKNNCEKSVKKSVDISSVWEVVMLKWSKTHDTCVGSCAWQTIR